MVREAELPEAACAESSLFVGHRWAEPSGAHLRAQMRQVFTERAAAKAVGEHARADMIARFAYPRVAEIIHRLLERDQIQVAA